MLIRTFLKLIKSGTNIATYTKFHLESPKS